jgi:hypothetical protein
MATRDTVVGGASQEHQRNIFQKDKGRSLLPPVPRREFNDEIGATVPGLICEPLEFKRQAPDEGPL